MAEKVERRRIRQMDGPLKGGRPE